MCYNKDIIERLNYMKKNGFTISEALVVLAAIGVLAMLTMPSYVSGQRKLTYSKVLQVAVANFNTAMTNMIAREGVDDLKETAAWRTIGNNGTLNRATPPGTVDNFARNLGRYIAISHYDQGITNYSPLDENMQANGLPVIIAAGNFVRFFTKNGVEYKIEIRNNNNNPQARSEAEALAFNTNYTDRAAIVRIDINGENAPNIAGRDLHFYELGIDGILYPVGSRDWAFYNRQQIQDPEVQCKNNLDGTRCAAYLANNNYNMDY